MDSNSIAQLIANPQFKPFMAFLKLSRDCLSTNPLVSYWALFYVLEQAILLPKQDDSLRVALGNLMGCLEMEKANRKGDPTFANEQESKKYIENYANTLLVRAENEAELGVSPSVSIKLYLACANVSQLLTLFGENTEENAKRIKYSKWKAVTIAKEAKAGPGPNAPSGGAENGDGFSGENDAPQPPAYSNNDDDFSAYQPEARLPPEPKPRSSISSAPAAPVEPEFDFSNLSLSDSDQKKAELLCESALYAIRGDDILSAVTSLKQTLQVLQKCASRNNNN